MILDAVKQVEMQFLGAEVGKTNNETDPGCDRWLHNEIRILSLIRNWLDHVLQWANHGSSLLAVFNHSR